MDTGKIKRWNIAGFFIIVVVGSLLHYFHEWTNYSRLAAAIAPVNECVWEHLKLGLWATILFIFIEYPAIGKGVNNYFLAKAVGVYALSVSILVIFYTYTLFTEDTIVALDILSYVIGVLVGQLLVYKINRASPIKSSNFIGITILISTCILFAVLTFYPPHKPIFMDNNDNSYGIKENSQTGS